MRGLRSKVALMVEIVTDIAMSAKGLATSKGTHGLGEDDGHPLESETAWHFGFYSRPKDGARGVVLKADGEGNTSFLFCFRDAQYELALEQGEVGMKNAFDATLLLSKDGDVIATSKSGRTVQANGTDSAAVMDTLIADLKNWVTAVNTTVAGGSATGGPLTAYAAQTAALNAFAATIAAAGAYKSTKFKHG